MKPQENVPVQLVDSSVHAARNCLGMSGDRGEPSMFSSTTSPAFHTVRRRGFSLAELLVVLSIVLFAVTVSLLAYGNYRKGATVRSAADKVRAAMVQARYRAIASGLPSAVVFDVDNTVIWIDDLDEDLSPRAPKAVAPEFLGDDVIIDLLRINANSFNSGVQQVVFRPDDTNPLVTVHLRREFDDPADDENYYSVQMYPNSAEPRVWANVRR